MAAVNWDQPSTGLVSDAAPSLTLANDQGAGLESKAAGIGVDTMSEDAEALRARTKTTLAARIGSEEYVAAFAAAPKSSAFLGSNESPLVAVVGANFADPAQPQSSLDGVGVAGLSTRAAAYGVIGATFGIRSTGVWGSARGGGVGVRGDGSNGGVQGVSTQGHGVAGSTSSKSFSGVFGDAQGPEGSGVSGRCVAGAGVAGESTAGPGVRGVSQQAQGVIGESAGGNASGVFGRNDLGNGTGVDGSSQNGIGVRALSSGGVALYAEALGGVAADVSNSSSSEPALKVYSPMQTAVDAGSITGTAVRAVGVTRTGVVGLTVAGLKAGEPEVGCGVYGASFLGAGVSGTSFSGTGVLGIGATVAGGWAGRFEGNVHIGGILFKSASLFSIDHPLDPKRKVLNHASVEAPEYKTFYDGVATLDARGRASVVLPRWFDALNHELRYQLTPIGAAAPDLHVARQAVKGRFAIAGGRPRQKVCWQVTGVRRDAWARGNPLQVEQPRKQARAAAAPVSVADLRKAAAALEREARVLQAQEAVRRRAAKQRRLPSPSPKSASPAVGSSGVTGARALDKALKLAQELTYIGDLEP